MRIEGDEMWGLLRSLDDPAHLEVPAGYDHARTRERFDRLVDALDDAFACTCEADRHVEDATLHARVAVPAGATASGHPLVVSVSNFGGLAVAAADNPGAWATKEFEELLDPRDADKLSRALDELDYVVIPEEPLWSDYTGPTGISALEARYGATWWTRFFDYL